MLRKKPMFADAHISSLGYLWSTPKEMIDYVISHDKWVWRHLREKCSLIPIDDDIAPKPFIFGHIIT